MLADKSFLVTRPRHEPLTDLLYYWCEAVLKQAKEKGYRTLDLSGEKANKKAFTSYMKKNKPALVFLNGHGSEAAITGHDNEVLVAVNAGDELFGGSVIYARSCNAAQILGTAVIQKGAKAFLGYKRKFTVAFSDVRPSQMLTDNLARLFLEPSNLIPISLLKGNSVGEADRRSKDAMRKNFSYMISSAATFEEQSVASYLWGNIKAQVVVGDQAATV